MMEPEKTSEAVKLTDEYRIDLIRKLRNDLIKEFLDERNLMAYFADRFNQKELNNRRVEFIKKELKELLIAPVDLVHYSSLLLEMKQDGTASISTKNEKLFYDELEKVFKKYIF